MDEPDKYGNLPIPTYEEAIASRPSSSQTHIGPEEISDDAERQGLLGHATARAGRGGYHPPTVESVRSSMDSDLYLPEVTGAEDEAELVRRDMEEMEIMDPDAEPSRLRSHLSKRFSSLTHSLSAIRLPSFRLVPEAWSCPTPSFPKGLAIPLSVVARLFGLGIIALSVYLLFAFNIIPNRQHRVQRYVPESVRVFVQKNAIDSGDHISDSLRYITSFDHVAGTEGDLFLAKWIYERWQLVKLDKVEELEYNVYLNYPTPSGRRVSIVHPPEHKWDAALEEDNAFKESGQSKQQTLNWHGSSKAGNVTGHLVYANGGSREDFQKLKDMGVNLNGSIALVRHFGTQDNQALKVKAAELAGAAGCLIYSDPKDDGFVQGKAYPEGPWRSADSLHRASVGLIGWVLGDYLTPGWASKSKADRKSVHDNPGLNNIPSLPLAWRDAQQLLQVLIGKGSRVPEDWVGGVPAVQEWWTGAKDGPIVLLQNLQDENKQQKIWNLRGLIQGVEMPEHRIRVGNHRDAWCFGAADPGSGTAVMMEVVSIFGSLLDQGWRPLRSIEFFSWDAGEHNMMGSTEFVEDHLDHVRANGIGYLNVGAGVSGSQFRAAASPALERMLMHVLDRVDDPVQNKSLKALWDEQKSKLEGLGAGGDYVAFQSLAGVSSLDFGFTGPKHGFPDHSCYDNFEWMEKFGDPNFDYHKTLAQVWALLILEMADRPILPYDLSNYAEAVQHYIDQLQRDSSTLKVDVTPLRDAANLLVTNARQLHNFETFWTNQVMGRGGIESNNLASQRFEYNAKLSGFEKDLLDLPGLFKGDENEPHGIPGREQYKHVIFGPQAWSNYEEGSFPAVRDALFAGNETATQMQINKAARIIERAAKRLLEE